MYRIYARGLAAYLSGGIFRGYTADWPEDYAPTQARSMFCRGRPIRTRGRLVVNGGVLTSAGDHFLMLPACPRAWLEKSTC